MEKKTILEVYKKRRYNELLIEKREALSKVTDAYDDLAKDYNNKLLDLLKADKKESLFDCFKVDVMPSTVEKDEKINEIEKAFKDAMDDRNRLVEEIEAQLDLCSTREEYNEVFKLYGIIDKKGKIYDYKN